MKSYMMLLVPLLTVVLLAVTAQASYADAKQDVLDRMKARLPQLTQAKDNGQVGEVWNGYVEVVKSEDQGTAGNLVAAENADRTQLFSIIAKETGATPDAVAAQFAKEAFSRASRGHWLKGRDNVWRQKS